jgi:hypothetical protein
MVEDPKISTARAKMILTEAGFGDFLYNKIYYALRALSGESDHIPPHLRTYVDTVDFNDVNM